MDQAATPHKHNHNNRSWVSAQVNSTKLELGNGQCKNRNTFFEEGCDVGGGGCNAVVANGELHLDTKL